MTSVESVMLHGEDLLARVQAWGARSRSELVRSCGYVRRDADGREHLLYAPFYQALLEAKGLQFQPRSGRQEQRRRGGGRQLSFNTHVHFNGNLMVGKAYTEMLQIKPGDQFRIHLDHGQIRLVPLGSD